MLAQIEHWSVIVAEASFLIGFLLMALSALVFLSEMFGSLYGYQGSISPGAAMKLTMFFIGIGTIAAAVLCVVELIYFENWLVRLFI